MKTILRSVLCLIFILLTANGLIGCAGGVLNVVVSPASYDPVEKINLKTMLYLDEDYQNAKWETEPMGWEPNVIMLGENFTNNTKNLANNVFSSVVVVNSESEISKGKGDVILKPKVKSSKQNRPLWKWHDSTLTVIVEWTLKDTEGNLIWIDTIKGEGVAKLMQDEERLQDLIYDLFEKSYKSMSSSPEIRDYAKSLVAQ